MEEVENVWKRETCPWGTHSRGRTTPGAVAERLVPFNSITLTPLLALYFWINRH
jgi:hypothetical protein